MKKHHNETFANCDVPLDGNEYVECTFQSCRFVFEATAPFGLGRNHISSDCRFVFRGAAGNTLNTLKAIYGMGEWGQRQILATFQTVAPDLKKLN